MSSAQSSLATPAAPAAPVTTLATVQTTEAQGMLMTLICAETNKTRSSYPVHVHGPRKRLVVSPKKPEPTPPATVSSSPVKGGVVKHSPTTVRDGSPYTYSPLQPYNLKKVVEQMKLRPMNLFSKK